MVELESLEPRMQLAYKLDQIPASLVADISLARLMAVELDGLLRRALDIAIGDTEKFYNVYANAKHDRRKLVTQEGDGMTDESRAS
ncbi:MAG TPA: hypothetical protein VMQ46_02020 [Acidimicrobiia bacterium]|jgi:hypothetical protein|nr:hypothetical protein [Acidimicrobiia bacterium]